MLTPPDGDAWFLAEVQPHRDVLTGWLSRKYPQVIDIENIVQEAMARVWRARESGFSVSPRALLFTTANHLAIDQLRRRRIVPIDSAVDVAELPLAAEAPDPAEVALRKQELELLTAAIQALPERCRQVLTLRKLYGLSQKQIAAKLGISENTVETQIGQGMRRCAAFLARHGLP